MLKDVALVLRGTIIAQVIAFLALPLLSRLLAPEAFGNLQLFTAILTVMLVFSTLRYEVAILRARDGRRLAAVVRLCLLLILASSLVFGLVIALAWLGWLPVPATPFPLWLLLLAFAIGSVGATLGLLVTRLRAFRLSGQAKIVQSSAYVGSAVPLAATWAGGTTLIVADAVGKFVNMLFLLRWAGRSALGSLWASVPRRDLRRVARRYREYPLVSVPGTILNTLGAVLSPFMMFAVFSADQAGYFGLVDRTLALPLALVVGAVAQVYTGQFASDLRTPGKSLRADFDALVRNMALLGAAPLIIGVLAAPALFEFVFGREWRTAGEFAQLLTPTFFLILVCSPTNMALTVLGHQGLQMAWEAARLTGQLVLWWAVLHFGLSPWTAVLGHSIVLGGSSLAYLLLARHMVIRSDAKRGAARRASP